MFPPEKKMVRLSVEDIKMAPEAGQVRLTYRLPEPIMITPLAGGGFEPPTSGL